VSNGGLVRFFSRYSASISGLFATCFPPLFSLFPAYLCTNWVARSARILTTPSGVFDGSLDDISPFAPRLAPAQKDGFIGSNCSLQQGWNYCPKSRWVPRRFSPVRGFAYGVILLGSHVRTYSRSRRHAHIDRAAATTSSAEVPRLVPRISCQKGTFPDEPQEMHHGD
jgi:hypothetical protein